MDQLPHVPQDPAIAEFDSSIQQHPNADFYSSIQQDPNPEIADFYSSIQDPNFLRVIDQEQFAHTPLHRAADEGHTLLALEIQRLMPSFGSKLNPAGFSPLHLALRHGHKETASAMVRLNPELICVQVRDGFTPLHYAAATDDADMLAEFLLRCPNSIHKLTVREESAVHVAVKNRNIRAFRVLLGWLTRTSRRGVLTWRDWEGNTVLHLAASTNQLQIMKLVMRDVEVNDKNSEGQTALDIVEGRPTEENKSALRLLRGRGARRECGSLANYLSSCMTFTEKILFRYGVLEMGLTNEVRNIIIVVAALVVTATYQAVLSPPGGDSHQTPVIFNVTSIPDRSSATNISSNIAVDEQKTQGQDHSLYMFMSLNSIALAVSLGIIALYLPGWVFNLLNLSLLCLLTSYTVASVTTSPPGMLGIIGLASLFLFVLMTMVKFSVSPLGDVQASRRLMGNNNNNIHEMMTLVFRDLASRDDKI